jgi:hypothetical protein
MAAGTSEDEAKTDLCHAMADKKINVQVRIAAKDRMRGRLFRSGNGNVGVPPHLIPAHFDWTHSQPVNPWPIGPALGQYGWIEDWESRPLDLIELCRDDVEKVLCSAGSNNATPQRARPNSNLGAGAKTIGIVQAIDEIWPNGISEGLSAKDRNQQIISKVKENGGSIPSERTIQRVLDKRRRR